MEKERQAIRILIAPNVANPYDQRMVSELAAGFNGIGHYAAPLAAPASPLELRQLCESFSIDVVLQINRTRDPELPLPPDIRHIAWYQDVFPETLHGFAEGFKSSDILYVLGDAQVLGLNEDLPCLVGSLFTGVDPTTLAFKSVGHPARLDFSLCGGLPHPAGGAGLLADTLWHLDQLIRRKPLLGKSQTVRLLRKLLFGSLLPVDFVPYSTLLAMRDIVRSFYRPLRGELDIHLIAMALRQLVEREGEMFEDIPSTSSPEQSNWLATLMKSQTGRYRGKSHLAARLVRFLAGESAFFQPSLKEAITGAIGYFAQSYPRILDREALVKLASAVSPSLAIYGPGMNLHDFAAPYFKGVIDTQRELLDVYSRSRINLSNNTHGLGLHSRTLECMATGNFLFMHESPHDNKPGGMLTSFEPEVHFGSYTPESFAEKSARWLRDEKERMQVGIRAQTIIRERHCWHHRAQQIIDDLKR
ncbi:MAG: glycosyltransferase [Sulfuritalea sp.]|nr:glycosyltransferase [Sulfuritalea sp.]